MRLINLKTERPLIVGFDCICYLKWNKSEMNFEVFLGAF